MKETSLYEGVEKYFIDLGFVVRAEVKDIDVCAFKDDLLIGIELKKNLSVDLLIQGALRQKVCDLVYIAVPRPKRFRKNKDFSNTIYLLKRLELGLFFVDVDKGTVEEILEPSYFNLDKARSVLINKRKALLKEIRGRSLSLNAGGSSRTRLMTAYREESLKTVAIILEKGSAAPRDLKGFGLKSSILRDNYYGWFKKLARGTYVIDESRTGEFACYEDYIEEFRAVLFSS